MQLRAPHRKVILAGGPCILGSPARPRNGCHTEQMSTDDQKLSSVIHGEALKAARDDVPQELLDRIAAAAEGNDEVRVRTAGEIAATGWPTWPATRATI